MHLFTVFLCLISTLLYADQKKVVFVTIPKSGTWLLDKAVEHLSGQFPRPLETLQTGPLQVQSLETYLSETDFPSYITHLFPSTNQIQTFSSQRFTKVLLIRDPRDVMISFLYHLVHQNPWPYTRISNFHNFAQLTFDEQLEQVLLFPPLGPRESILQASAWMKDPDVHVIRFEDLVGKAGGGSDEAQLATLATLAQLMGLEVSQEKLKEVASTLFGGTRSFHKGQIGAWKSGYNEENKKLFKFLLGQATIDLGYATDLDW